MLQNFECVKPSLNGGALLTACSLIFPRYASILHAFTILRSSPREAFFRGAIPTRNSHVWSCIKLEASPPGRLAFITNSCTLLVMQRGSIVRTDNRKVSRSYAMHQSSSKLLYHFWDTAFSLLEFTSREVSGLFPLASSALTAWSMVGLWAVTVHPGPYIVSPRTFLFLSYFTTT